MVDAPPDRSARPSLGVPDPAPGPENPTIRRHLSVYKTRYQWKRRLLFGVVAFVMVVVVGAAGLYGYAQYRYHQIRRVHYGGLTTAGADQPMNILMVGNNSRCALNGKQATAFGSCGDQAGQVAGARSDVIMILHLDPAGNRVSILSIPRDIPVPVPGFSGEMKVDSTLNYGPSTLIQTIEDDFGIHIDHFVELNFDSFQGVVDALGGIDMYFPMPVTDRMSGLNPNHQVVTGCLHLTGAEALQEVRARHVFYYSGGEWVADGGGDLSRIRRDHEFLRDLASQVVARGIGNPLTANAILGNVAPQLTVDSGMTFSTLLGLVERYHAVSPSAMPEITLPVVLTNGNYFASGSDIGNVVFPSQPFDQNAIDTWLGLPGPPSGSMSPSGISVEVVNASGEYGLGTRAEQQLSAAGFSVTDGGTKPPIGTPAETIIVYSGKQGLPAAQRLADNFSGAVMLESGTTPAGTDLVVDVTSSAVVNDFSTGGPAAAGFTVVTPPATHPATSASPTTAALVPSTTEATTTTISPIGAATNSQNPLKPWDPRACPLGAQASPAPPGF